MVDNVDLNVVSGEARDGLEELADFEIGDGQEIGRASCRERV